MVVLGLLCLFNRKEIKDKALKFSINKMASRWINKSLRIKTVKEAYNNIGIKEKYNIIISIGKED